MTTLAFLGLGMMGEPMAAQLARQASETGARVLVWNRTFAKAQAHAAEYGSQAVTLEEAARADFIFSCLPTSADVDSVMAEVMEQLKPGALWIDCTSGDPQAARAQAHQLRERGVGFLDAPVSGGPGGAKAGILTVMIGGAQSDVERVLEYLAFARKVVHVGDVGAGFAVKAINNALLAVNLWAAGEGLATLGRAGVNMEAALEVINASSGRSNASENLIPQRVMTREFTNTFSLGLLAKDAGIAAEVAAQAKASAPVLVQVAALFRAAEYHIGANVDHTAALKLIEQMNNQEIKETP